MSIRGQLHRARRRQAYVLLAVATATSALAVPSTAAPAAQHARVAVERSSIVIPKPVSQDAGRGRYTLTPHARIVADAGATGVAHQLADDLRPATGYPLPVVTASGRHEPRHCRDISLRLDRSAAFPATASARATACTWARTVSLRVPSARTGCSTPSRPSVNFYRLRSRAAPGNTARGPCGPRRSSTIRATGTAASCSTSPGTTSHPWRSSG